MRVFFCAHQVARTGHILNSRLRLRALVIPRYNPRVDPLPFIAGYIAGLATLLILWIAGFVLGPWARALTSKAPIPLMTIVGMRLRRTPAHLMVDAYARLTLRNKKPNLTDLETLYLTHRDHIHTAEDLVDLALHEREPSQL